MPQEHKEGQTISPAMGIFLRQFMEISGRRISKPYPDEKDPNLYMPLKNLMGVFSLTPRERFSLLTTQLSLPFQGSQRLYLILNT